MSNINFFNFKTIVFDFDGTIVNSMPFHVKALNKALDENGIDIKVTEDDIKGIGTEIVLKSLSENNPLKKTIINEKVNKIKKRKKELYELYIINGEIELFSGTVELLEFLKLKGVELILISGSGRQSVTLLINKFKLKRFFEERIVVKEDVKNGKPKPDLFKKAIEKSAVKNLEKTLIVEDSENGLIAGIAAGVNNGILVNQSINNSKSSWGIYASITELFKQIVNDYIDNNESILLDLKEKNNIFLPDDYSIESDKEFFFIVSLGKELQLPIYLLRIGGPLLVRRLIKDHTNILSKYLQDCKTIILISNPLGYEALKRFDAEDKDNYEIRYTQNEIIDFAENLFDIRCRSNKNQIEIGFHENELLWSCGIVEQYLSIVRAYYDKGTGHDNSVKSKRFLFNENEKLAESFLDYFKGIQSNSKIKWLKDKRILKDSRRQLPSLFKSNIKLFETPVLPEKGMSDIIIPDDHVWKICSDESVTIIESNFYKDYSDSQKLSKYFRPVKSKSLETNTGDLGNVLALEKINGLSLFDIVCYINKWDNDDLRNKLLISIIDDSIMAIKEFWHISKDLSKNKKIQANTYDYQGKLEKSYDEIENIIYLPNIKGELKDLGQCLKEFVDKSNNKKIFRDAHLKNRIWKTNMGVNDFLIFLVHNKNNFDELLKDIYDIDFETVNQVVTPWEDGIHILFFEYSGYDLYNTDNDPIKYYEAKFNEEVIYPEIFLKTILARSYRELCRRIWYYKYMPKTFNKRYGNETPRFFCDLGIHALERLNKMGIEYKEISFFLKNKISDLDGIFDKGDESPIPLSLKNNEIKENNSSSQTNKVIPTVFISYSWDNKEHEEWVLNLATKLCENGVNIVLDKWDLVKLGQLLPDFMEKSITKSQRVICIMTPNYKKKTDNLAGGVGYEYSIISAEIFTDDINTSKFIPLFRKGTDSDAIPTILKGRKYVDMRNDFQFEDKFLHELLRDIHDEPKFKKPIIGEKPIFG
ncbi:HAD-IA family hydrolase [Alistipes sp. ZOR0009]|uniref:HAD-IA family hydrolase n=1 Tax=Alistipes sp. ZOR0009 TaxID=1339253 RepID=UPI00069144CC|nr:HAD-IA family hydrolase [Alistipes sp. ZOR0009]